MVVTLVIVPFHPLQSAGMSQQQQHQDPVSGFPCGAATPQSPLLSPRMGQGQSPMLQQSQGQTQPQGGAPGYQASTDLNGWPQPANISTSNRWNQIKLEWMCVFFLNVTTDLIGVFLLTWNVLTQFACFQCVPPTVPVTILHTTQRRNVQQQQQHEPGSHGQQWWQREPDVGTDELHEYWAGELWCINLLVATINVHFYDLIYIHCVIVIVTGEWQQPDPGAAGGNWHVDTRGWCQFSK